MVVLLIYCFLGRDSYRGFHLASPIRSLIPQVTELILGTLLSTVLELVSVQSQYKVIPPKFGYFLLPKANDHRYFGEDWEKNKIFLREHSLPFIQEVSQALHWVHELAYRWELIEGPRTLVIQVTLLFTRPRIILLI